MWFGKVKGKAVHYLGHIGMTSKLLASVRGNGPDLIARELLGELFEPFASMTPHGGIFHLQDEKDTNALYGQLICLLEEIACLHLKESASAIDSIAGKVGFADSKSFAPHLKNCGGEPGNLPKKKRKPEKVKQIRYGYIVVFGV